MGFKRKNLPDLGCPCLEGYMDNRNQNDICVQCHYSCEYCTSLSKYECVSCKFDDKRFFGKDFYL